MKNSIFSLFLIASVLTACGDNNTENQNQVQQQNDTVKVEQTNLTNYPPFGKIDRSPKNVYSKDGVTIEAYDFENFETFLHQEDDYTYVVNFWATWCVPCVAELPYFEELRENYLSKNVHVVLVSIDFSKVAETGLLPFVKEKELKSEVILLDDPDANSWIDKVDKTWSGSIPATLIYNKQKRKFFEKSFTYIELENELLEFLNYKL